MTKAMPFLQKAILLSYDPRRLRPGYFLCKPVNISGDLTFLAEAAGNGACERLQNACRYYIMYNEL